MRCLQIFGAYSYRLSRRHSTMLLIASLITSLTVILHIYSRRTRDHHPHMRQLVGDFDYRPGLFLKGKQPNENRTYCHFNYGLPHALDWESVQPLPSPDLSSRGSYRVIYDAIKGTAYANVSQYDSVTYVTQATPEFIYHIIEIAKQWDGPISLSVFVPDYDLDITMQIMNQLCRCYEGMSKVSLHLFYTKHYPPKMGREPLFIPTETPTVSNVTLKEMQRNKLEKYRNLDIRTRAEYIESVRKNKIKKMMIGIRGPYESSKAPNLSFNDCSGLETFNIPTFRRKMKLLYPINVGRNSARNASRTNYFILSDIELLPSDGLAPKFLKMLRKLMGDKKRDTGCIFAKTVFVVPLFEVERGEQIPRDKSTLVQLVKENRATYFHQKICPHCQRFPGLQTWLNSPAPETVEPLMITHREYPYHRWEPLYFGTNKEPWYSEALSWEGLQDKMTQMNELCLQKYRLVVLDGAFLCHPTVKLVRHHYKHAQNTNLKRYMQIIDLLKQRYPNQYQCRVY